ncbi:DNA-protecting protein DprA [Paroceanicella profunda]|uniref:DNA-protecting protein DprA n=1 Tax=Paroceanicella profunda TaxID=2579971 RepID=A0A5B8FX40_9RHOB|nr:DNA-processing protein DprA [Paroceanicella profunda]QDL90633.1 DNA-protecting protein DprA [Paroceanicella profunda]
MNSPLSPLPDPMSFTPPRSGAEVHAWLRLARSRNVGPRGFRALVTRFGSAEAALEALPGLTTESGKRFEPAAPGAVDTELERARALGARLLCLGAPEYPALLAQIPDPPPLLWARGAPGLACGSCIAVVGARNASSTGRRMAALLAQELGGRGHTIVSGLARGIDTAAHRVSLASGTIAVLAGGLDRVYPAENADLAEEISLNGLLLSEAPLGEQPTSRHFPRRNRIVSGLSRAVVLVEAADRSGSLITARLALEQGREVMAVPGSPLDPRAGGCNRLLRQGAALVRHADDVEEALGYAGTTALRVAHWPDAGDAPDAPPEPGPRDMAGDAGPCTPDGATPLLTRVEALLSHTPASEDDILRQAGAPPAQVLQAIGELELTGRVERRPGGGLVLAD